jgi:hypothetical protein
MHVSSVGANVTLRRCFCFRAECSVSDFVVYTSAGDNAYVYLVHEVGFAEYTGSASFAGLSEYTSLAGLNGLSDYTSLAGLTGLSDYTRLACLIVTVWLV